MLELVFTQTSRKCTKKGLKSLIESLKFAVDLKIDSEKNFSTAILRITFSVWVLYFKIELLGCGNYIEVKVKRKISVQLQFEFLRYSQLEMKDI